MRRISNLAKWICSRRLRAFMAAMMLLFTVTVPVAQQLISQKRYILSEQDERLVGKANTNLSRKLTYDANKQLFQFNKDGLAEAQRTTDPKNPVAKLMQAQVGGADNKNSKQLYSLDLAKDLSKGITVYDNNLNLNFKLVPMFDSAVGQLKDGHLIYPIDGGQAVYTLRGNGLKEDVLLNKAPEAGRFSLTYKLVLPEELESKPLAGGGIGIYSADPVLYGNISFGDTSTQMKVMESRKTAPKNNLVFALPAPVIKQSYTTGTQGGEASFVLRDDKLTLEASELANLNYPLSIDPSVAVTSSTDFSDGNNEGNIDFGSGQINRGNLTGGSTNGGWSTTASFNTARYDYASVAYNGYLYILGGSSGGPSFNDVQYAPLNSNGTVGVWHYTHNSTDDGTTFVSGFMGGRTDHAAVAYNGYLYVLGGYDNGPYYNDVQYAPLNSNGTVGVWHYTHNSTDDGTTFVAGFNTARLGHTAVVYNGYLYVMGGTHATSDTACNSIASTYCSDVQYAPINANGTIGTWQTTTSMSARRHHTAIAYNGYLYILGGSGPGGLLNDVQYAPINANGTIGTWTSTTSFANTRENHTTLVHNGYLYVIGGNAGLTYYNDVQYAPINANGTIGTWRTTTSFTTARQSHAAAAYNGYLYIMGGYHATSDTACNSTASNYCSDVQYAKIDPAGVTTNYTATTSLLGETSKGKTYTARTSAATVAYNGYLYVLGGGTNTPASYAYNSVIYAPINANGTLGTWVATASFTTALSSLGAVAYNGYMYIMGGNDGSLNPYHNDVQYAPINANGTLGVWAATTSFISPRDEFGTAVYNGYLYVLGGRTSSGDSNDVQYAPLNSNGTVGAWHYTHNSTDDGTTFVGGFINARNSLAAVTTSGYLYILGGNGNSLYNDVQYAPLNSNGTVGAWHYTHNSTDDGTTFVSGFTNARVWHTAVAYNGYIYIMGGNNNFGTLYNDVQYAPINTDGTIGAWATTASFTTARQNLAAAVYDGYLYIVGGSDGTNALNDVQYTQVNNRGNGAANTWQTDGGTSFSPARNGFTTAAYNGYLYIMGGYHATSDTACNSTASNYCSDVQYAPINTDGTIGTWNSTASFITARTLHAAVAYNGYLYILGGARTGSIASNDVQYAPINANGTVGAWHYTHNSTDDGTTFVGGFTNTRRDHTSIAYNGYLYIMGGYMTTNYYNDVQYAQINANGTVGAWQTTNGFSGARYGQTSIAYNGYLYIMGGYDGTSYRSDVQYAPININGTLGSWTVTTSFTTARYFHASTSYNGYLYILGGATGTTYYNDAQYASLNVMASKGIYSKLIDLGTDATLSSITYTGVVPGGSSNISYVAWDSSGATIAASGSISSINGGGGKCSTGGVQARYVFVRATLDDSQAAAAFPDINGSNTANLQDITINYSAGSHPPPNIRLRAGQSLQAGNLSSLDTCGV